jgi:hypothetical protein
VPDPEDEDEGGYEITSSQAIAPSLEEYNHLVLVHMNHCPRYLDALHCDDPMMSRLGVRCGCGFIVQLNVVHARNSGLTQTSAMKVSWLNDLKERATTYRTTYVPTMWERLLCDS